MKSTIRNVFNKINPSFKGIKTLSPLISPKMKK